MAKKNNDGYLSASEARRISSDPDVKGYNSIEELRAALDAD